MEEKETLPEHIFDRYFTDFYTELNNVKFLSLRSPHIGSTDYHIASAFSIVASIFWRSL